MLIDDDGSTKVFCDGLQEETKRTWNIDRGCVDL